MIKYLQIVSLQYGKAEHLLTMLGMQIFIALKWHPFWSTHLSATE